MDIHEVAAYYLLQRISELGVHSTVVEWFKDYLSNRYHRIKSSATFSSWRLMKGSIPQGSAQGSLFLIYMNSLPAQLANGLLLQNADNTTIICTGATPAAVQNTMCSQLSLTQQWILQSKIKIKIKIFCYVV